MRGLGQQTADKKAGAQYVYGTPAEKPVLRPLRHPLYDTEGWAALAAVTVGYELFTNNTTFAVAGFGRKNESHTNMPGNGTLGTPLEFDLVGFTGHLHYGVDLDEFNAFYNRGVFRFIFGQSNPWLTVKLNAMPQGIGPHGATTVPNASVLINGWGTLNNFYNFTNHQRQARKIHSNERFRNPVYHPSGITPLNNLFWTSYLLGIFYMQL